MWAEGKKRKEKKSLGKDAASCDMCWEECAGVITYSVMQEWFWWKPLPGTVLGLCLLMHGLDTRLHTDTHTEAKPSSSCLLDVLITLSEWEAVRHSRADRLGYHSNHQELWFFSQMHWSIFRFIFGTFSSQGVWEVLEDLLKLKASLEAIYHKDTLKSNMFQGSNLILRCWPLQQNFVLLLKQKNHHEHQKCWNN